MIRADLGQTIMDDQADRAPWTIKGITPETRQVAKDAANRAGLSVGEWLAGAVRRQADQDRGNAILPPGKPGQTNRQTEKALALVGDRQEPRATLDLVELADPLRATVKTAQAADKQPDLRGLADALRATVETAQAADELPSLRGLARDATGLLRDQIRIARGLSVRGRGRSRQAHEENDVEPS